MVQFNLGHQVSVRCHLSCHPPGPSEAQCSCRVDRAQRCFCLEWSFVGTTVARAFPVLSLASDSLPLLLSPCVLAFTETGSNPSAPGHVTEAWSEGRSKPSPCSNRVRMIQVSIYKVVPMEHFTDSMLDARWLVLLPITSRPSGCPSSPSCIVMSLHSPRELALSAAEQVPGDLAVLANYGGP